MKKRLSKSLLMTALITGMCIGGVQGAFAADNLNTFALDEYVVTATRTMKQLQEVPASVSVVTAKDIEERNAITVQDALQYVPGLYLNQARVQNNQIKLRGMGTTDILVLVDGVQMNTTYNGEVNLDQIPVDTIERIEVLRGAASSIYGGRAVAGVINITTKEAKEGTKVNAAVSYGSNNTWKKSLNVNSKVNEKISFGLGYENSSSDGYRGYFRTATGSTGTGTYDANLPVMSDGKTYVYGGRGEKEWKNETYTANIKYNFDDSKSLKYNFTKNESNKQYVNPFSYVKDSNGNQVFNGSATTQNGHKVSFTTDKFYGYDNVNEKDTHILTYNDTENNFTTSFSYVDEKVDGFSSANLPSGYDNNDWTGAGDLSNHPGKVYNFSVEKAWENIGAHTIVVGANYKKEKMIQHRYNLTTWRDHNSIIDEYATDSGETKNLALFIQDEYKLSDPLTMYLGLRYDHYEKGDGSYWSNESGKEYDYSSEGESFTELSPKVAFDYKADDKTNYYVSYGHSFNPPPLFEIYRYGGGGMGGVIPNPELEPETSDTFEIGMKKKLSDKTDLGINLYHIKTDDKIAYVTFKNAAGKNTHKQYINYNEEKRRGVEFELNHEFSEKWNAYFNYAWQNGKTSGAALAGTNKDTSYSGLADYTVPKHLLHAGVQYNHDKWNVLVDCQYVSERQKPDEVTGEYGAQDAFFLVNTALNYKLTKDMTMQFGVYNLFDRQFYCDEATAGRTYNVSLRYSF